MILRDKLYINTAELGYKISNLCELFTYKNPEIFHKKRLKLSIRNTPPFLYHYKLVDADGKKILQIPRGGLDRVIAFYKQHNIPFRLIDQRVEHLPIDVHLVDTILDKHQERIVNVLIQHEGGLVEAPPGMGKSITMLGLISNLKQPTLIIVHEHRLSDQWMTEIKKRLSGTYILGKYDGDVKKDGDIVVGIINSVYNLYQENPQFFDKFGTIIEDECLDPDTVITVPTGIKKLRDIKVGDTVITPTGAALVKRIWTTTKEAFKYKMTNGNYLITSKEHIVHTYRDFNTGYARGTENKQIQNCSGLLFLKDIPKERIISEFDLINYLYGWFIGDGTCDNSYIKFSFRKKEKIECFENAFSGYDMFNKFGNSRGDSVYRLKSVYEEQLHDRFDIYHGRKSVDMRLPDFIYATTDISFIRGLFEADGCRHADTGTQKQNSIELSLILKNVIYQVADMLRGMGIYNTVTGLTHSNSQASLVYRVSIPSFYINTFNEKIGWFGYKNIIMNPRKINRTPFTALSIKSVEPMGNRDLIDIELEDENKLFIANGIIVHNCQHAPAEMFLSVLNNIPAKYRIGISGTIKRKDQKEILTYDVFGKVLMKLDAADLKHRITTFDYRIVNTNISMEIPTIFRWTGQKREDVLDMTELLTRLVENKDRNVLIVQEAIDLIQAGYFPLILSDRVKHNEYLHEYLNSMGFKTTLMIGKTRKKTNWEEIRNDTTLQCIVANSKIASEGLDLPRLSALLLTCPSTNVHKLKQQIGRIRRVFEGKPIPIVVDFCDNLARTSSADDPNYLLRHTARTRIKFYEKLKNEYDDVDDADL